MAQVVAMHSIGVEDLGGIGRADPARCANISIALLKQAVGDELALASLSLELGPAELRTGRAVDIRVSIDKRTRAVAFTTVEATTAGEMAFTARGLFAAPNPGG